MRVSVARPFESSSKRCITPSPRRCIAAQRPRVLVRFQEDSRQKAEELQQRRQKEEAVIRGQEQKLQEEQAANGTADVQPPHRASPVVESIKKVAHAATSKPELDPYAPRVSLLIPAFTRRREIFVGRIAMVGFFAACFWECVLEGHPNITQQVAIPFELAGIAVDPSLIGLSISALIVFDLVAALLPFSPTWSKGNQLDIQKRPPGPPNNFVNPFTNPKDLLGVTGWGFTKANELFHGRIAMLGFYGALLQQIRQGGYFGPGPLAQVAGYLGVVPDDTYYSLVSWAFISFAVLATALAYWNGWPGSIKGEEDVY